MNLRLKNVIKDFLENDTELVLFIRKEELDKYLKFYRLESDSSFIFVSEELYKVSIKEFYNFVLYEYFDLGETLEDIIFNVDKYLYPMDKSIKENFIERWESDEDIKRVVISHQNCDDGAGVVEVFKYYNKYELDNLHDIEYLMLDYSNFNFEDLLESLRGKLVYVGDFSFNKEQLDKLMTVVGDIVIVDHHESVLKMNIQDYPNVHLDLSRSGAILAWEFFYGVETKPPYIIELIGDRDVWNFFYGNHTKAMKMYISKNGHKDLHQYVSEDEEVAYVKLIDDLEPYILEVEREEAKHIKKAMTARPYNIHGVEFVGLNITSGVSEILNHASRIFGKPSFAFWEDEDGIFQLSFRNYKDDIAVNDIARVYGGDGHFQASGNRVNYNQLCLEEFFINKRLVVKYKIDDEATNQYFTKFGTNITFIKSTLHCEAAMAIENKSFHELFVVGRDNDNNVTLKLK
jgi:hypothetical protein